MNQSYRQRESDHAHTPLSTEFLPLHGSSGADDSRHTSEWLGFHYPNIRGPSDNRNRNHYPNHHPNRNQFEGIHNSFSEDSFTRNKIELRNQYERKFPTQRQHRRIHSADARPQYHGNKDDDKVFFEPSSSRLASYRDGTAFAAPSASHTASSNRPRSDMGTDDGGTDSFGFFQLPRYEAVIHDDSVLYSGSDRREYGGNAVVLPEPKNASNDFPVRGTGSSSRATAGISSYNNNTNQRRNFDHQPHLGGTGNTTPRGINNNGSNRHQYSSYEKERQYYDYAKDNLITFGSCDAPTASTGLSQEELLHRKRREDTRQKRKEKRRSKTTKNRIINFPSGLLRGSSGQHQDQHLQQQQQQQQQNQSSPSNYKKMGTSPYLDSDSCGEIINNNNSNKTIPNSKSGRAKGIRGAMVSLFFSDRVSVLCTMVFNGFLRLYRKDSRS